MRVGVILSGGGSFFFDLGGDGVKFSVGIFQNPLHNPFQHFRAVIAKDIVKIDFFGVGDFLKLQRQIINQKTYDGRNAFADKHVTKFFCAFPAACVAVKQKHKPLALQNALEIVSYGFFLV